VLEIISFHNQNQKFAIRNRNQQIHNIITRFTTRNKQQKT